MADGPARPGEAMTGPALRPSQPLYDALAAEYDAHFAVPHRRLYDQLAWERFEALLADAGVSDGVVVDAGCGIGRWARMLLPLGFTVVGIEQSPGMIAATGSRVPAGRAADGAGQP